MNKKINAIGKIIGSFLWDIFSVLIIVVLIRSFFISPFYIRGSSMVPTFQDSDLIIVNKFTPLFMDSQFEDVIIFLPPNPRYSQVQGPYCMISKISAMTLDESACLLPEFFIKRVIGVPGDTIEIKNHIITNNIQELQSGRLVKKTRVTSVREVWKNGKLIDEPYLNETNRNFFDRKIDSSDTISIKRAQEEVQYSTYTVPEGRLFVLGDNRNGSDDSRSVSDRWKDPETKSLDSFAHQDAVIGKNLLTLIPGQALQSIFSNF
ncbi:signal peptidase I [Candidatus Peregrinibacteria bacterium]|nr:MAG: signal peptidase I [Candidatus Peregrinibacteria bacterium]